MNGELGTPPDIFLIKFVFNEPLNHYDDGLVHLVADYCPDYLSFY